MTRLIWLDDQPWPALLQACPDLEKEWWESDLWILPAGGVIDAQLLRDAVQRPGTNPITVIDAWPRPSPRCEAAFFRVSGAWLQPLVEASGDLGGHEAATFRHILLPLALPGVVAGQFSRFR